MGDGVHRPVWQDQRVRVRIQTVDDFLNRHHRRPRRQNRLFLHANNALDQDIALAVSLQRMDKTDIRIDRRHSGQNLAGEGAGDLPDLGIDPRQVCPDIAAQHGKGQFRGAGLIGMRQRGVRMLDNLDPVRPPILQRITKPSQQPDTRIASIGENHPGHTAHADHLVIDHVRRHPHNHKVAPLLADHLMRGGIGHQMGETFKGRHHAIRQMRGDGVLQRHELCHDIDNPGSVRTGPDLTGP